MNTPTIRRVTDPKDPVIPQFGQLQSQVYFEPDMLIPARYIALMLADPGDRVNFLLVAEEGGDLLGGTVFHYLPAAGSGFSSFMGVARAARGRGVARALHEARWAALNEAAGGQAAGVFIDVVSPERLSAHEREAEAAVGSDPLARRRTFQALGFRTVDLRYEQPVGGENGGPVTNMDLLFCPSQPTQTVPVALVVATMRAYWTPWMGPDRAAREAGHLAERAGGQRDVPLLDAWRSPAM